MVAVFILVSILVGLSSAGAALFMGAGFWGAVGWYVLGGSVAMIVMPGIALVASVSADRARTSDTRDAPVDIDRPLRQMMNPGADEPGELPTTMRILAVDDDPFVLEIVPKIAASAGFREVTTVPSGAVALSALATPGVKFDCLLLDIKMPEMDGIELCRRVRNMPGYDQTPIIMLTAMRDLASMSDAYQAGASDYATKPFDVDELAKRLQLAQASNVARVQRALDGGIEGAKVFGAGGKKRSDGLVSEMALSSYLSKLTGEQVGTVNLFALSRGDHTAVPLEQLASATARCIGPGLLLMARTDDAQLLFVVDSKYRNMPSQIESEIARQVAAIDADHAAPSAMALDIGWGGPVTLSGSREARARLAIDRAIIQATSRHAVADRLKAVGFGAV